MSRLSCSSSTKPPWHSLIYDRNDHNVIKDRLPRIRSILDPGMLRNTRTSTRSIYYLVGRSLQCEYSLPYVMCTVGLSPRHDGRICRPTGTPARERTNGNARLLPPGLTDAKVGPARRSKAAEDRGLVGTAAARRWHCESEAVELQPEALWPTMSSDEQPLTEQAALIEGQPPPDTRPSPAGVKLAIMQPVTSEVKTGDPVSPSTPAASLYSDALKHDSQHFAEHYVLEHVSSQARALSSPRLDSELG